MKELLKNKNEVVVYTLPILKDSLLTTLNSLFALFICAIISYLLGYYLRQKELNILLVALITSSTFMNITWKQKGERIIVVDSNFMIFFDKMKAISKQKVFIISKISKLSVNKDYNHNLWMRIKSFWKKGAVGCISFSYEGKIVYFGDNLTIEEAKKLICLLNERQFLVEQNFQ